MIASRGGSLPGMLGIFLFVVCQGSAPAQVPGPRRGIAIAEAEALIAGGRFREAREAAQAALDAGSSLEESIRWRRVVARAFAAEGDPEEASAVWDGILAALPESAAPERAAVILEAARSRLRMWDAEGAFEILKRLPAGKPADLEEPRAELNALALFMAGRRAEARDAFEAISGKSSTVWHHLGLIAFDAGDHARALDCFTHACASAREGDADLYYDLLYSGWCLLELDRLAEAREALGQALEAADTPEALLLLGRVEMRAGKFEPASSRFQEALARSPDLAEARFGLATALRRQGKTEEARSAFERFRDLHRRQQEALRIAYALHQKLQAKPGDLQIAVELARHQFERGDLAEAERLSWRALRLDPSRPEARLNLARILARSGRNQEAAVHYRKILRAHRDNEEAERELRELIRRFARQADG